MACDPNNPIRGGMCSLQDTGPPDVILSLRGAIKTPEQLESSKAGNYDAIGKNLGALGYYASSLGEGTQFKGYGIRKAYSTGIECSNLKGQYAHRLADGTAVGIAGEYGVVPRLIGSLGGLVPSDLVSSAKTGTTCKMMWIHENTDEEANNIRHKGTDGVPAGNKIAVSDADGVDYIGMNTKCERGAFGNGACKQYPVQESDINPDENFRGGRRHHRHGRRPGPYWRRRWYNRYPVYYSPPVVIDRPVYDYTPSDVVVVKEQKPSSIQSPSVPLIALIAGVVSVGTVLAMRK